MCRVRWTTFEQGAASIAAYWAKKDASSKHDADCPARGGDGKLSLVGVKMVELAGGAEVALATANAAQAKMVVPSVSSAPSLLTLQTKLRKAHFTGKGDREYVVSMLKEFNTNLNFQAKHSGRFADKLKEVRMLSSTQGGRKVQVAPMDM